MSTGRPPERAARRSSGRGPIPVSWLVTITASAPAAAASRADCSIGFGPSAGVLYFTCRSAKIPTWPARIRSR